MPALSPTMEEGNIVKWLKKEGNICMEHRMKNLYHQLFPGFFFFLSCLKSASAKAAGNISAGRAFIIKTVYAVSHRYRLKLALMAW